MNKKTTAAAGQQQMLEGAIARGTLYARNSKWWGRLTNAVMYYVAKNIMSLQSFEKNGFRHLL